MLYHNSNRFQSKYLPVRVSITSVLKSNTIISPVQLRLDQVCPAQMDTMFAVVERHGVLAHFILIYVACFFRYTHNQLVFKRFYYK